MMEFIKCPECSSEVGGRVKICPRCGFRFRRKSNKKMLIAVISIIVLFIAVWCIYTITKLSAEEKAVQISIKARIFLMKKLRAVCY